MALCADMWTDAIGHDVLVLIFLAMDPSDRARAACACRAWRAASRDRRAWARIEFADRRAERRAFMEDPTLWTRAGAALDTLRVRAGRVAPAHLLALARSGAAPRETAANVRAHVAGERDGELRDALAAMRALPGPFALHLRITSAPGLADDAARGVAARAVGALLGDYEEKEVPRSLAVVLVDISQELYVQCRSDFELDAPLAGALERLLRDGGVSAAAVNVGPFVVDALRSTDAAGGFRDARRRFALALARRPPQPDRRAGFVAKYPHTSARAAFLDGRNLAGSTFAQSLGRFWATLETLCYS